MDNPIPLNLSTYDFSEAKAFTIEERLSLSLAPKHFLILPGATATEVTRLEQNLGVNFPVEYRLFLQKADYVEVEYGLEVRGTGSGRADLGSTWLSNQHRPDYPYLVIGSYWKYADGDDLLLDPSTGDVFVYFHDVGQIESYAPSFSLALWRLTHEN